MQKLRYFPPERQPRSVQAQPLRTVLVPGKRKAFVKQVSPPVPPRIDNRNWHSTAQVLNAIATNRLHPSFAEQALAETRAYEMHFSRGEKLVNGVSETIQFPSHDALNGEFSQGFYRGKKRAPTSRAAMAVYLRRKLANRR